MNVERCSRVSEKVAERNLASKYVYRSKASFGAPIRSWISGELSEMIGDFLSPEGVRKRGIFNPTAVQEMIRRDRLGLDDYAYQIYQLLTLEIWFREFMD